MCRIDLFLPPLGRSRSYAVLSLRRRDRAHDPLLSDPRRPFERAEGGPTPSRPPIAYKVFSSRLGRALREAAMHPGRVLLRDDPRLGVSHDVHGPERLSRRDSLARERHHRGRLCHRARRDDQGHKRNQENDEDTPHTSPPFLGPLSGTGRSNGTFRTR